MKFFDAKPPVHGNPSQWIKCGSCNNPIYEVDFVENFKVCPKCGFQHRMTAYERLNMVFDQGTFRETDGKLFSVDPLEFGREYMEKLEDDSRKTDLSDAVLTGTARVEGIPVSLGIMDFSFRGGSMGSAVGEKLVRVFELAIKNKIPAVVFTASGGARMQEGVIALMQMAKTSAAVNKMREARVPYIVVLTDPTTGGVSASFASLGDITIAESKAIIGFSGARVIEQTIRQKLPPDFQSAEYSMKHGFADIVVPRLEIRQTLIDVLSFFKGVCK